MFDRVVESSLANVVIVAALMIGCSKDSSPPTPATRLAQLIDRIETVDRWSRSPERGEHVAWLGRAVAWDIVGAVAMTAAGVEVEESRIDGMLRSGLAELAVGPGDHVASLVRTWRDALGTARCRSAAAPEEDVRWIRERLALVAPKGAGPDAQRTFAELAERAKDTRDFVRVECGGEAPLVVGVLGDRLVPILRS